MKKPDTSYTSFEAKKEAVQKMGLNQDSQYYAWVTSVYAEHNYELLTKLQEEITSIKELLNKKVEE